MPLAKLFKHNPIPLQYVILTLHGCLHTVITLSLAVSIESEEPALLGYYAVLTGEYIYRCFGSPECSHLRGRAVHPEDVGTPRLRNVRQYLPFKTAFDPRRRLIFKLLASELFFLNFSTSCI